MLKRWFLDDAFTLIIDTRFMRMKIGYCRVSTDDQDLNAQVIELSNFGCSKIISDVASGIKQRVELDKLLKSGLREGDTLVVYRLDRLGRSLSDLLNIFKVLNEKQIYFVSLSENIDTSTPQGKLLFSISGAFAEYERSIISERTKLGLKYAKKRGIKLGRPKGINSDIALYALDLKNKGKSAKDISNILKISKSTVYRYLKLADEITNK